MANPTHPTCSLALLWPVRLQLVPIPCLPVPVPSSTSSSAPGLFRVPGGGLFPRKLPQNTQPCCLSTPLHQSCILPQQHRATSPGDCEPTVPEGQGKQPRLVPFLFLSWHTHAHRHTHTHLEVGSHSLFQPSLFPGHIPFYLDSSSKWIQFSCRARMKDLAVSLLYKP